MKILWVASTDGIFFGGYIDAVKAMGSYFIDPPKDIEKVRFITLTNLESAVSILYAMKIDVLITDLVFYSALYNVPPFVEERTRNGVMLLRMLREGKFEPINSKDMPVIIFTSFMHFLDISDGKNTARDFVTSRDILMRYGAQSNLPFVAAVKTALASAGIK